MVCIPVITATWETEDYKFDASLGKFSETQNFKKDGDVVHCFLGSILSIIKKKEGEKMAE